MTITVKHNFQSAKADGTDPTLIQPSNWNENHIFTMATARLVGRYSAGTGAIEEITIGSGLALSAGGELSFSITLAPVATSGSAADLSAGVIDYARLPARLQLNPALITDANTATTVGFFAGVKTATLLNFPDATKSWVLSVGTADTANDLVQVAQRYDSTTATDFEEYIRVRLAGTWSAWTRRYGTATELATFHATAAEFRNNTADKVLTTDEVWSSAATVALVDAPTVTIDMATAFNFSLAITANRTLDNPTNPKVGQSGFIQITQDATGSRTLAYGANWKFANGTAPALSTAANAVDVLFYQVISATRIIANLVKGVT